MSENWSKADIGTSFDADLCALYDFLEEWGTITDNGEAICAYNLLLGTADNCPTLRTLFAIHADGELTELCRDNDEVEIINVLPEDEIVVLRSVADDDYEPFSVAFSEADVMAD